MKRSAIHFVSLLCISWLLIGCTTPTKVDSTTAEQSDTYTQYRLGLKYLKAQDYQKAFEPLSDAAEQGHAASQARLGSMHILGKGVPKDHQRAFELFSKAAGQGFAEAQYSLGQMYLKGLGISQNHKRAFEWCAKAAEQGFAPLNTPLG